MKPVRAEPMMQLALKQISARSLGDDAELERRPELDLS